MSVTATGGAAVVEPDESRARRMWRALEGVHVVGYFAPEAVAGCEALGTRGYWASYFAQRAAPLGRVGAGVVAALFYGFHPGLVARSVPAVWELAPPERFVEVRLAAVDAALRRLLGGELLASAGMAEAAELGRAAAQAVPTAGRALAAAHAALPWPSAPHLVLWQAQAVLREHRGDGHVAALLTAGLDPAESLVLFAAGAELDPARLARVRGWSAAEWVAARDRLAARGLVEVPTDGAVGGAAGGAEGSGRGSEGSTAGSTAGGAAEGSVGGAAGGSVGGAAEGSVGRSAGGAAAGRDTGAAAAGWTAPCAITAAGRRLRAEVEERTDELADVAWRAIGDAAAERLFVLSAPLVRAIVDGGGIPADNPMGLRPLVAGS